MSQLGYIYSPPVASSSESSANNLAIWQMYSVCLWALATPNQGAEWNTKTDLRKYVIEAKRRGYTPECCAEHLGRTTATTLDESKSANKVTTSRKVKTSRADLTPEERCVLDLKIKCRQLWSVARIMRSNEPHHSGGR